MAKPGLITINGIPFTPNPLCNYKNNYLAIAKAISTPELWKKTLGLPENFAGNLTKDYVQQQVYRELILTDLWFVLYFVIGLPSHIANTPFAVNQCKMVDDDDFMGEGYRPRTLDIWSRGHLKTAIFSIAETIQYHLKYPEFSTIIFCYKKGLAEIIANSVRRAYESEFLKSLFPDCLYNNPLSDSPLWTIEKGLIIKRKNKTRKEPTIYASGLAEGMAQGFHSERLVFDDFETFDMSNSPDALNDSFLKFQMAQFLNSKTIYDRQRVLGTIYSHLGPIVRIMGLKIKDGTPQYKTRIIPGTEDGAFDGKPVFWSQEILDTEKLSPHYPMQVLCNPTPTELRKLKSQFLKEVEAHQIPRGVLKFMLVDWAGDDKGKRDGCDWAFLIVGVDPKEEESAANNVYLLDCIAMPMPTTSAVDYFTRMYLSHGVIQKVGIETSSGDAIKYFAIEMLRQKGRVLSEEAGNIMDLKPRGRNKDERILAALDTPLNNGKLHMSMSIPAATREKIKLEIDQFPFGKKDILDAWSYLYDVIRDFPFSRYYDIEQYSYPQTKYHIPTIAG